MESICVSSTSSLHRLEKILMETACCFQLILKAVPYKTTAVRQLTFHLKNRPNMRNK